MTAIALLVAWFATQAQATIHGIVVDPTGAPIAAADIRAVSGSAVVRTTSATDGSWTVTVPLPARVTIASPGFAEAVRLVESAGEIRAELTPQAITEHVTVTGRGDQRLAVETSATTLDRRAIERAPALTVDDQLRAVPGFSLFRRTSSRAANPTTQGVTLRGLSASGASRTLVVADDVPLNDPFGAWVYWDRVPIAAIDAIEINRGALSDLHGNDALGGVIRLTSRTAPGIDARIEGGGNGTWRVSGYGGGAFKSALAGAAAERFRTDGYVVIAPESRGPIDTPAGVASTSSLGWLTSSASPVGFDLRGGYFSESRNNGTPAQVNATVSRWAAGRARGGAGGGLWELRADWTGSDYRQTFSAVAADRTTERLTSLQWVAASSTGATASWLNSRGRGTMFFAGSTRYWTANLDESSIPFGGSATPPARTSPWQRSDGLTAQARFDVNDRTTLDGGIRVEAFRSRLRGEMSAGQVAHAIEPRLSWSWRATGAERLRISWLTGFRAATMNELFRSFRVGNALTMANSALRPERVWGPEVSLTSVHGRLTARAIGYATHMTDAIYSRTLSVGGTTITRQRSNATARAIGSELELEWRAASGFLVTSAWALNDSQFTAGDLAGKRIPQVPRVSGSIGARLQRGALDGAIDVRVFGRQYDDDVNAFVLRGGAVTDARIGWTAASRVTAFAALENAFDADVDTGRTPIRTVGTPRTLRVGLRVRTR